MKCRSCGSEVPEAADACRSCGTLFPALAVDGLVEADRDRTPVSPAHRQGDPKAAAPTVRHPADESATEVGGGPPDLDLSRFPPGTLLADRYRIVGLLGKGAMGEVYRADDLKLAMPVALKFLPEAHERDEKRTARFLNEVKVARQVSHPNVCRVFDVGEVDGHSFLSMEYVDGEDLVSLQRRIGRLPYVKALEVGREMARGLAAIHREGILHRDLKPANLMIDGRGRARITDFGIASLAASIHGDEVGVGTPAYMSPEQLSGREVTARSDLYALGLVLYELFAGRRAYDAGSVEALTQRMTTAPPPPSTLGVWLDPAVERVILRCLKTDPRDRPSSAAAVAAALAGNEDGGVLKTLVAGELVGRERWVEAGEELSRRHGRIAHRLLDEHGGREIAGVEGLVVFERPIAAVGYALAYHRALAEWSRQAGQVLPEGGEREELAARAGIHLGEVVLPEEAGDGPLEVEGAARTTVERLLSLAVARQTLLTRAAFDLARQSAAAGIRGLDPDGDLHWLAHGAYRVAGSVDAREVFEVGAPGSAPLAPPADSDQVRRVAGGETIPGWRPAPGLALPSRPNWVVEKKLGEGGFGEVWLAGHRKTGERRVFKFCYEATSLRALQREITLFRLLKEELGERDDITRILDWNLERAPYFIESEYTEGGSLLDWAEEQGGLANVPLATRLELLAQVADALAAAHSVGVLHKDVKPANVLITADRDGPRVRLTDFGVGLITDRERLASAGITVLGMTVLNETESAQAGTRLYMAPELVEGKAATVQADVYALGVMLYQLAVCDFHRVLAPGWQRDLKDELLREDVAAAVEGSVERRLGDARRLAERLRSLESRREARRADLRQLQARLEKLQKADRAVAALERARKRRRLMALAVAVLVLVAAALALHARRVGREAERAEREAARANREAEASRQVSEFLVELFEVSDPYAAGSEAAPGQETSARDLLDRGAEKIAQELADQPEIQARLMRTMGVVYRSRGLFAAAGPLLEQALTLRREVHGDEHPEVAESLGDLALFRQERGDYERAEALYREALLIRRRLHGEEHPAIADTLFYLGSVLFRMGDYEAAEPPTRAALAMRRRLLGSEHLSVASSLNNLAVILRRQGDQEAAEPLYREALAIRRRLLGDEHPDVANSLRNLASLLASRGDYADAEPLYREALRTLRGSVVEHPDVALTLYDLAWLLLARGDYEAAEPLARAALAMRRRLLGDEHPDVANSLSRLAACLQAMGDDETAEALIREALVMRRRLLGDEHPRVATSLTDLAGSLIRKGEFSAAEDRSREALEIYRQALPAGHWRIHNAESVLGEILTRLGRYEAAEPLLHAAYPVLRDEKGERSPRSRDALARIVALYEAWGRPDKAAEVRARLEPAE
ncbi:MAG: tetratricopeptide repeat protein [bacterium]|nr:tetratricopeptide repeat protein [bacterium]